MFHNIIDAFLSFFDRFTPKALLYLLLSFSTFKGRTVFMIQNPRFYQIFFQDLDKSTLKHGFKPVSAKRKSSKMLNTLFLNTLVLYLRAEIYIFCFVFLLKGQ